MKYKYICIKCNKEFEPRQPLNKHINKLCNNCLEEIQKNLRTGTNGKMNRAKHKEAW